MKPPLTKTAQKKKDTEKRKKVRAAKKAVTDLEQLLAFVWRFICYERAGRKCEVCGTPYERGDFRLQAHHLVKRSQSKRLQLDPMNSMALCPGHHMAADRDPIWALGLANELRGVGEYLVRERRNMSKIRADEIIYGLLRACDLHALSDPRIDELRTYHEKSE